MEWNFACPDWVERLKTGRPLIPDLPLFEARAKIAVDTFNGMCLPDVRGYPRMADAAGDWYRDIVRASLGSIDDDGVRHVPEIFCMVPKKNSKTTNSAALALTAMLVNDRPNAEMMYVGPTQEISGRAFRQSKGMIRADPDGYLQKRFRPIDNEMAIKDLLNGTILQVKTFDTSILTGGIPVWALLDEVHLLSKLAYASDVVGQLRWGMMSSPDAFLMMITTQSFGPPAGLFKQELHYARGVRDGLITDSVRMLPVLYEFPEAMQIDKAKPWLDAENWPMVHPNLGRSVTIGRLVQSYKNAKDKGEDEVRRWAGQNLNVEIGLAMFDGGWRGQIYWEGAADSTLTLDTLIARCEVLVVGIDGGGADDLLGLCVAGREKITGKWLYWFHAWVDRALLKDRPEIAERLRDFEKAGDLTLVDFAPVVEEFLDAEEKAPEGKDIVAPLPPDVVEILALVKRLDETGLLPAEAAVGVDRAGVVMTMLTDELVKIGITNGENDTKPRLVSVAQGGWLNAAIGGLPRKLRDGTARHGGQPMMAWCVGNAKVEIKGHSASITKQTSGSAKIDPLCAGFNATMLLARNPVALAGNKSFWEGAA